MKKNVSAIGSPTSCACLSDFSNIDGPVECKEVWRIRVLSIQRFKNKGKYQEKGFEKRRRKTPWKLVAKS